MKFTSNFWWISTCVGTISAFTFKSPRSSPIRLKQRNDDDSLNPIMARKVRKICLFGDHSSTRRCAVVLSAKESPHPPDYIPRVDEQLELDLMESERRVMLYEKEVEMIREELVLKQSELLEEQNIFRDEKRSLMGKIAEFTTVLAQRDKELEIAMERGESESLDTSKADNLENNIRSLESQLQEKANALENEKKSSEELRKRLDDAEDALEFEQMNFEKERRLLQELVTNERRQVKALQEKFEENNESFEVTRQELLNKIKAEEKTLRDTKAKWKVAQEELQLVERKLEASFQESTKILKATQLDYDAEKEKMSDEITYLQNQIKRQDTEMEEIKSGLKEEIQDSKSALEKKIETEERMIEELQQKLTEEQNTYKYEKSLLGQEIESISANLADVETQLANERANFSKEKDMLEKKLANEIRVGKLKKKQMKKRYDEIRSEMTGLWESSKRQARQEERRLRKKYERKLDTVKAQIVRLENDMTAANKRIIVEQNEMQRRHVEELQTRDATIFELEASVANLGQLIADKDIMIKEKDKRIKLYETSFRQVAKLGLVVTGNKMKKVAGPLKRLVQNSPPSDDVRD